MNGREVPGTLVDFGLLIFHTGKILASTQSGPFFYLSKVEGATEAILWNDIFVWAQLKLGMAIGTENFLFLHFRPYLFLFCSPGFCSNCFQGRSRLVF